MARLHRHQIAWLSDAGWQRLLQGNWDEQARHCLHHWARHRLPTVVTRQPDVEDGRIALGLCASLDWGRRRLALRVQRAEVLYFDEFPQLQQIVPQLPHNAREPARQLVLALKACGATARVYGSHGWQHFTILQHVCDGSDLDVWVAAGGESHADAVAAALNDFAAPSRRLDGELVFDGDAAVAWREWLAWRDGRVQALLVKRLRGASIPTSMQALA